jgi:hypothetical protein
MARPASSSMSIREARDLYFERNGFSLAGYSAPTFTLKFLGIAVTFPSTANRKRALPLHDLHHIVTGYGTDWIGEAEISAWELRAGARTMARFGMVVYWLDISGVMLGMLISPRRIWRAFRAARGQRTLFDETEPYDTLLEMNIDALRRRLGIPPEGVAGDAAISL